MKANYQSGDLTPLVGVRPDVMAEAEHGFGNLLHRMRYWLEKLRASQANEAVPLESALAELEDLLHLVLDYVSPMLVTLQKVSVTSVLGSLVATVGECAATGNQADCHLVLDPARLSEAFQLMRASFGRAGDAQRRATAAFDEDAQGSWLRVQGVAALGDGSSGALAGRALVSWALAQKLVEAQGGILNGEVISTQWHWELRLPLPARLG